MIVSDRGIVRHESRMLTADNRPRSLYGTCRLRLLDDEQACPDQPRTDGVR